MKTQFVPLKTYLFILCLMIVIGFAITAIGCASMDRWATDNADAIDRTTHVMHAVGAAAAPATGGISLLVSSLLAAAVPTVFAVNRAMLAHRRGKAIQAIDDYPKTPKAADQAPAGKLRKTVRDVTG